MPEKIPVHLRHFLRADQIDSEFRAFNFQFNQQRGDYLLEQTA